eukprot:3912444-Pyramimonas_sp.AAC.1
MSFVRVRSHRHRLSARGCDHLTPHDGVGSLRGSGGRGMWSPPDHAESSRTSFTASVLPDLIKLFHLSTALEETALDVDSGVAPPDS